LHYLVKKNQARKKFRVLCLKSEKVGIYIDKAVTRGLLRRDGTERGFPKIVPARDSKTREAVDKE
jgi:hypothetical protein